MCVIDRLITAERPLPAPHNGTGTIGPGGPGAGGSPKHDDVRCEWHNRPQKLLGVGLGPEVVELRKLSVAATPRARPSASPRAPPMLSAGHGHDCLCASHWPRATRSRTADRMVAWLPALARAWPATDARAGGLRDFYARLPPRSQVSYFDRQRAGSDGCRYARLALHAVRIESARVVALHVRSVCAVSSQVELLRRRLHQPPARPSSRPQVRTARTLCRPARTHSMRWRSATAIATPAHRFCHL
jgi:hypothetical protein